MTQLGENHLQENSLREIGEAHVLHVDRRRREAVDVHRQVQLQHKREASDKSLMTVPSTSSAGNGGNGGGAEGREGGGGADWSVDGLSSAAQSSPSGRTRGGGSGGSGGGGHTRDGGGGSFQKKRLNSTRTRKPQGSRVTRSKGTGRHLVPGTVTVETRHGGGGGGGGGARGNGRRAGGRRRVAGGGDSECSDGGEGEAPVSTRVRASAPGAAATATATATAAALPPPGDAIASRAGPVPTASKASLVSRSEPQPPRPRLPPRKLYEGVKKSPRAKPTPKRIRYRCDINSTIGDVLRDRGWTQVGENDESWQLNWCEVTSVRATLDRRLTANQLVPHFRNHYELTRKNLLARNLKRLKRLYQRSGLFKESELCDCMPVTFELPSEYLMFVEEYRRHSGATWIVKPVTGCQGRGIFLFQRLKELVEWRARREAEAAAAAASAAAAAAAAAAVAAVPTISAACCQGGGGDDQGEGGAAPTAGASPTAAAAAAVASTGSDAHGQVYVVQRYVEQPYLVAGRKFDIRLYVLVTSFRPLKAWLAREGFARFSTERFSLAHIRDQRVHLTNISVQMRGLKSDAIQRGCKWSMRRLREYLTARHGAGTVDALLQRITRVVVTSLQSVRNVITQDKHCFELYGYDILLDQDLRPWLLEVNASPSLAATDPADYRLKYRLLMDTLNVLDLERRLSGRERRVGGYDLIWNAGPVPMGSPGAGREGCCEAPVPLPGGDSDGDGSAPRLNAYLGCCNERERQLEVVWRDAACVHANSRPTRRDVSPSDVSSCPADVSVAAL